jgi:hypothetical protein
MTEKPHKGRIEQWEKQTAADDKTIVWGVFANHPEFGENVFGHTSYIVSHDEATGEIETRNSRYTLGTPRGVA